MCELGGEKLSSNLRACQKILFLGYDVHQTKLIGELIADGYQVWHSDEAIDSTEHFDIAISFGYQHIIPSRIIGNKACPIVNLHLSYLPYNRGAHPNFWSFYDQTPSGVTIHLVDVGIDTGGIVCQKLVDFDDREITFVDTYKRLRCEIEDLFLEWKTTILSRDFSIMPQKLDDGTFHRESDLPNNFSGWDSVISIEIARLHRLR